MQDVFLVFVQKLSVSINVSSDLPAFAFASPEVKLEEVFNEVGDPTIFILRIRASATDFTNMAVFLHIDLIKNRSMQQGTLRTSTL